MNFQPRPSTTALACKGLSARYGSSTPVVLDNLSFALPAARWTCIVGPNGAGKSSLLMALAGLMPLSKGQVFLWEKPLSQWPVKDRAQQIAWLGQKSVQADDLRVEDIVMLGRIPHQGWLSSPSPTDLKAVEQAMVQTQCAKWRHRAFGELSGGEQQRVLLARALAVEAQVLLMDEPLSNLDPPHQADWLNTIRQLLNKGVTVVSVLHELPMALQADELLIMSQAKVVHQGSTHNDDTHQALSLVFDHRIQIRQIEGQWTCLPRLASL